MRFFIALQLLTPLVILALIGQGRWRLGWLEPWQSGHAGT